MMPSSIRIIFFLFLFSAGIVQAQQGYPFYRLERKDFRVNPFRYVLNKVSLSMDMGYGNTYFTNQPPAQLLRNDNQVYANVNGNLVSNWFNRYTPGFPDTLGLNAVDGWQTTTFRSNSPVYPLSFGVHIELGRFKVGGGGSLQFHRIRPFTSVLNDTLFLSYTPDIRWGLIRDYYVMGGYKLWEYGDYRFDIDARVGYTRYGRGSFDAAQISNLPFFAVGASAERVYSEYFRVYLKPMYSVRSFNMGGVDTFSPSFMLHLGFVFNYPRLPRSPIKSDQYQREHVVLDPKTKKLKYVRGQPFWKKQNPHIGELYPRHYKYKWNNIFKWRAY